MSAELSSAQSRSRSPHRLRGFLLSAMSTLFMTALVTACDPHAESAGSDNSAESGTAGSATDEGTTPDAMGRKGTKDGGTTAAEEDKEASAPRDQQQPQ
jgi:hypothetical protein